jgi:hypothetical protein
MVALIQNKYYLHGQHLFILIISCTFFYVFILILFIIILNFFCKADAVGNRLSASNRYRGSRESLQSGMTYSARKNSNASMYNGINFQLFLCSRFIYAILFFYFLSSLHLNFV